MALNYDEAITELRQEEKRLLEELEQVRAAIPGLIILRNRNQGKPAVTADTVVAKPTLPGIGRFAGKGATQAIPELLKGAFVPMTTKEVFEALQADGWTTGAKRPAGVVSATLQQLTEKNILEKVGEGWRLKTSLARVSLNPAVFLPNVSQQPS